MQLMQYVESAYGRLLNEQRCLVDLFAVANMSTKQRLNQETNKYMIQPEYINFKLTKYTCIKMNISMFT